MFGGSAGGHSAAGGSGYIGNSSLINKHMIGYNVEESSEESTKTISVSSINDVSETPQSDKVKIGNGFARISFINR